MYQLIPFISKTAGAVRILNKQEGGLSEQVYNEFLSKLKGRLSAKNVELITCQDSHSETNHPLLILCFSATRLCTDVDSAIKDLKGNVMVLETTCQNS